MTQIDKVAIAAKKEAQRAIQYPRVMEPVILTPDKVVKVKVSKKAKSKKTKK